MTIRDFDGIKYVVWSEGDLLPANIPKGCEYESDGGAWKPQRGPTRTWGRCRRRWPYDPAKLEIDQKPLSFADDPDFPGCPDGCECPSDKGCGIG